MIFTRWGCDFSENVSAPLFHAVQSWAGRRPDFWGLYLWDRHMQFDPGIRDMIPMLRSSSPGCRVLPIMNRVVDRRWSGSVQGPGEAHGRGVSAARKAKELALNAGIPPYRGIRIFVDLECENVSADWMRGWTEELLAVGQFLPGIYGNHRGHWAHNLFDNTARSQPAWLSKLRIWASHPCFGSAPHMRDANSSSGLPFNLPGAQAGRVRELQTTVWQAWEAIHVSPHHVVDVDVATEGGYAEMF